ncbi:substrate-binding periplasmic protein, partial [Methylobacterium soli]
MHAKPHIGAPGALRRLALAACGLLLAAPALARPLDAVVASGSVRVALYGDNAPFSSEEAGRPRGIDVDLAKAIAEKLGVSLDLRIVDAGENVDGDFRLNLWKGDLAGSSLADLMLNVPHDRDLALRNEQIFLTNPYFDQHLAFAYRKGKLEGVDTLADLEGQPVALEG